jgi:hypothetical protein
MTPPQSSAVGVISLSADNGRLHAQCQISKCHASVKTVNRPEGMAKLELRREPWTAPCRPWLRSALQPNLRRFPFLSELAAAYHQRIPALSMHEADRDENDNI